MKSILFPLLIACYCVFNVATAEVLPDSIIAPSPGIVPNRNPLNALACELISTMKTNGKYQTLIKSKADTLSDLFCCSCVFIYY